MPDEVKHRVNALPAGIRDTVRCLVAPEKQLRFSCFLHMIAGTAPADIEPLPLGVKGQTG
jgi:hypothetical protein